MLAAQTTLVLFGATSDLAVTKLFPALAGLFDAQVLHPEMRIIAVSRRGWNTAAFHTFLAESRAYDPSFCSRIEYADADFDAKRGYDTLAEAINATPGNDLAFYLALAPIFFMDVIDDLRREGLLTRGSTKLILEKPYGTSEATARDLTALLDSFLDPAQVFRVDHYLGKSAIQALMRSHEASTSLRDLLSNETVAQVTVELTETKGVNGRASYDQVGAFRDVGQNHMLSMLAVTFAEYPRTDAVTAWQDARAVVIESLALPRTVRRGQYDDYLRERGVRADSTTETAFHIDTVFTNGELAGIPVSFVAGKRLERDYAGVTIALKPFPSLPSRITIEVQPTPRMILGYRDHTETIALPGRFDAYGAVLADALSGNQRHFLGEREVIAAWRYTDRLMEHFATVPVSPYGPGHAFL
jgi:glucose-6-phosphate 1-dehydrogenase